MTTSHIPVQPLNDFQRLMRLWDEFQPFSGIEVIEALGSIDAGRLQAAAEDELEILGVGLPQAAPDGLSVTYPPGRQTIPVELIEPAEGAAPLTALAVQSSRELNHRFRPNLDPLTRLWILRTSPRAHIGMTWQHWPMDGVSAADLFRRILARFVGSPILDGGTATDLTAPATDALFQPFFTWRRKAKYLTAAIRELYDFSRIYSTPRPNPKQTAQQVHFLDLPHPPRPAGATVNDMLAAALVWALAKTFPERLNNWQRRRINLVNIADLRPYAGEALRHVWGSYIGSLILHMPEPTPSRWEAMLASLRSESLRLRESHMHFAGLSAFSTLRQWSSLLPRRWRWSEPYRWAPYTAGFTSTRLRAEWATGPLSAHFGRSRRVAPLGSMTPLVVNACSKGNQLSLALTCEDNGLMSERIDAIITTMREVLAQTY